MLGFGGKSFVSDVSGMITGSTVSMLIVSYLGPAALAIYARPVALVRNLTVVVNKFAMVFSPTISSLQGADQKAAVRDIVVRSTYYGICMSLPPTVFLIIFGGEVLQLWMGNRYAEPALIAALSIGMFSSVAYLPLYKAVVSLNLHGQPGIINLGAAGVIIASTVLSLKFLDTGLMGVAIAVSLPSTLVSGVYLPIYACRKLGIDLRFFIISVWRAPAIGVLPFAVCLAMSRLWFQASPHMAMLFGGGLSIVLLGVFYWITVIPLSWKKKLVGQAHRREQNMTFGHKSADKSIPN
jgi:O-antigen/teichoic acid export membrane protein